MAVPDPHAIPESDAAAHEYLQEADQAWDAGDNDHAYDLYHALRESHFASDEAWNHAGYRLGLIAQTRGDIDLAVHFLSSSHAPGAAEALHALKNATTNDPTPDPDKIPETAEQFAAWLHAATEAEAAQDWQRYSGLYRAAAQSPQAAPSQVGLCYRNLGLASEQLGDLESALRWYEQALPLMIGSGAADEIRQRIHALGGGQVGAADDTPAATQVAAGINAYENGDAAAAHTALSAALHLEGPDEQKARARYYLGAMDYQAARYADARVHVEAAAAGAPEPERSWAHDMLQWRWDEHPAATGP
jgi:tetratricopeptide (TPR) repeat protein